MTVSRNLVTDDGAVADFQKATAVLSIASGNNHLTSTTNLWVSGDNGKKMAVGGAGIAGGPLLATFTFVDAKNGTLSVNASASLVSSSQVVSWGTDNKTALQSFLTWAAAQVDPIQLTIPSAVNNYGIFTGDGNFVPFGIGGGNTITVLGTGATICDPGFQELSPQLQMGGKGQQNTIAGQSLITTTGKGSTTISFVTVADAAKYSVGNWLYIGDTALQTGGYPLNLFNFEYQKITAIDAVGGTFSIAAPGLKNAYSSTRPNYGSPKDDGGPASVFLMHSTWDMSLEFSGLTVDQVLGTGCVGRSVVFDSACSFLGTNGLTFSQCKDATIQDSAATNCLIEVDKGYETFTWKNTPVRTLSVQSGTINSFNVIGTTISSQVTGTPRNSQFTNCVINSVRPGCFYGRADSAGFSGCSIATFVVGVGSLDSGGTAATGVQSAYTMVGGKIIIPKASISGPLAWAQPGAICFWSGQRTNQRTFKVLDVVDAGANIEVQTDQQGGFPSVPLDGSGRLSISGHPCPSATFIGCTGDPIVVDLSALPPAIPLFSRSSRTYSGDTLLPNPSNPAPVTVWGSAVSVTINVSKAYTGTQPTLTLQAFDGPTLQSDNSAGRYTPVVNLLAPGSRVITPSGVTFNGSPGSGSGDSGLALPTPGTPWFSDTAFLGPNISANVSGESSAVWPIVTISFQTDQGLPGAVVPLRFRLHA